MQQLTLWAHSIPGARFGWVFRDPASGGTHTGVDMVAGYSDPVYAMAGGTVRMAEHTKDFMGYGDGYGLVVEIEHESDKVWTYTCHLGKLAYGIKPGKKVHKGDLIGYSSTQFPHEMITPVRRDRTRVVDPVKYVSFRSASTVCSRQIQVQKLRRQYTGTVYSAYLRDRVVRRLMYTDYSWAKYEKSLANSAAHKRWVKKQQGKA